MHQIQMRLQAYKMHGRHDNNSANGANAWKRTKERNRASQRRSFLKEKQHILHTSRHRKLHAVWRTSIQLLERVVLLLLFHIEVFDQIRYVVVVIFCSTGAGPLLALLNRLI
jgi:hypothetical protein